MWSSFARVDSGGGTGGDAGSRRDTGAPTDAAIVEQQRPVIDRLPVDLSTAFDFEGVRFLDKRVINQGPVVASGKEVADHPGAEPSLLLQLLRRDVMVVSGLRGEILTVREQTDTCDFEVIIIPEGSDHDDPAWVVGYDHLKDVTVEVGDTIEPGDVLGTPGSLNFGCDGPGRVELQINQIATDLAHCPLSFFSEGNRTAAEGGIVSTMQAWNTLTEREIYDAADLEGAGCLTETTAP